MRLLSKANPKLAKGEALGWHSYGLSLAPHTLAGGPTLCPWSTASCRAECLNGAGRGAMPIVQDARVRKARLYLDDSDRFYRLLRGELDCLERNAKRTGKRVAVRLNVVSDVWHGRALDLRAWPSVTFYGYTKRPPSEWPSSLVQDLTYSLSKGPRREREAREHLAKGGKVAVVCKDLDRALAVGEFEVGGQAFPVVDGDAHDLRFLDPPGHIVLLSEKGPAKGGKLALG